VRVIHRECHFNDVVMEVSVHHIVWEMQRHCHEALCNHQVDFVSLQSVQQCVGGT
jgi:hypothetical protein